METRIVIHDEQVKAALARLAAKVSDMSPAMHEIGQYYERRVLENFAAESDPEGRPWPKLSAVTLGLGLGKPGRLKKSGYLARKGRQYLTNKKMLVESGGLRRTVHYQADRNQVSIGAGGEIRYAGVHQFGSLGAGRGRKTRIPARPYLAMNEGAGMRLAEKDRRRIIEIVEKHIEKANG
ncbi:MAG: phage virion morphogenesis protein [Geobacteraceae bacterium]|nr:phage virion morphogenesis protein [Geobacteraceae bacterium]